MKCGKEKKKVEPGGGDAAAETGTSRSRSAIEEQKRFKESGRVRTITDLINLEFGFNIPQEVF